MTVLSDLPSPVVRSIIARARSRCIPGTNRYAQVCRGWRAASHGTDDEQLQLLLAGDTVGETELQSFLAWMQQHGACTTGLSISGAEYCWDVAEQLLPVPNILGGCLTRLELGGADTLLLVVPYLQQLPGLQHLQASISLQGPWHGGQHFSWDREGGEPVEVLPNMTQLCPQLVSMHLKVDGGGGPKRVLPMDPRLPSLLPVGLQQLHLEGMWKYCRASSFTHLTALSHLVLDGVQVASMEQLAGMSRLQQLELWRVPLQDVDLAPLASKLVGLWDCTEHNYIKPEELALLTRLTALSFHAFMYEEEPAANPLLGLTSLRHLHMKRCNSLVLKGLSDLRSLRGLTITEDKNGYDELTAEQMELVAQATQLTSLRARLWRDDAQAMDRSTRALQQLTGLQHLCIDERWLVARAEALTALQQLTQLGILQGGIAFGGMMAALLQLAQMRAMGGPPVDDGGQAWQEALASLQGRPPHLQQVLYLSDEGDDESGLYGESLAQVAPSPLPGVPVMRGAARTYYESPVMAAIVRPNKVRPCPHLPGVWELLPGA